MDSWRKTQEETKKRATQMESDNRAVAKSYQDIKDQVLGLIAVLVGAKDMGAFIGKTVTDLSAVGRMAVVMGQATPDLIAISMAVERIGGNAQGAQQSMLGLSQVMSRWRTFGIYPGQEWMNAMGFIGGNPAKGGDTPLQILQKFASWAETQKDKTNVETIGQQLGFNQDLINEAMRGRAQVDQDVAQSYKLGIPTDDDIKKLQALQDAWNGLGQALKFAATEDIVKAAPVLTDLFKSVTGLIDKFPAATGMVLAFGAAFLTWKTIATAVAVYRGFLGLFGVGGTAAAATTATAAGEGTVAAAVGVGAPEIVAGVGLIAGGAYLGHELNKGFNANVARATKKLNPLEGTIDFLTGENWWMGENGPASGAPKRDTSTLAGRELAISDALASIGVTGAAARGVVAGLLAENPNLGSRTKNPLSTARGLAQWTRSGGRRGLFRQVMGEGLRGSSFEDQVKFLIYELSHGQARALRGVKGSGSASAAALAFLRDFEAPGGPGLVGDMRRAQGYLGGEGTTVQIGEITINTRATDAKGIARDIKRELASQIPPNANGLN